LTAFCYWSIFATGDRILTTPTFLQAFGHIVALPGTAVALIVPPTGVHSGVFNEVSFVANALSYSLLAYGLFGHFGKTSKERHRFARRLVARLGGGFSSGIHRWGGWRDGVAILAALAARRAAAVWPANRSSVDHMKAKVGDAGLLGQARAIWALRFWTGIR